MADVLRAQRNILMAWFRGTFYTCIALMKLHTRSRLLIARSRGLRHFGPSTVLRERENLFWLKAASDQVSGIHNLCPSKIADATPASHYRLRDPAWLPFPPNSRRSELSLRSRNPTSRMTSSRICPRYLGYGGYHQQDCHLHTAAERSHDASSRHLVRYRSVSPVVGGGFRPDKSPHPCGEVR